MQKGLSDDPQNPVLAAGVRRLHHAVRGRPVTAPNPTVEECVSSLTKYVEFLPQPETTPQGMFDTDIRRVLRRLQELEAENSRLREAIGNIQVKANSALCAQSWGSSLTEVHSVEYLARLVLTQEPTK